MSRFARRSEKLRGKSAQRAIDDCLRAIESGSLSNRHIDRVLRVDSISSDKMAEFERNLFHKDGLIRGRLAEIVAKYGDGQKVIQKMMCESVEVFAMMAKGVSNAKFRNVDALVDFMHSEDLIIRDEVIRVFDKVGRGDLLMPLLFDDDERIVNRVRRILYGQGLLPDDE